MKVPWHQVSCFLKISKFAISLNFSLPLSFPLFWSFFHQTCMEFRLHSWPFPSFPESVFLFSLFILTWRLGVSCMCVCLHTHLPQDDPPPRVFAANLPVFSSKKSALSLQGHIINRASTALSFLIWKLTPNRGNQDKKKEDTGVVEQIINIFKWFENRDSQQRGEKRPEYDSLRELAGLFWGSEGWGAAWKSRSHIMMLMFGKMSKISLILTTQTLETAAWQHLFDPWSCVGGVLWIVRWESPCVLGCVDVNFKSWATLFCSLQKRSRAWKLGVDVWKDRMESEMTIQFLILQVRQL